MSRYHWRSGHWKAFFSPVRSRLERGKEARMRRGPCPEASMPKARCDSRHGLFFPYHSIGTVGAHGMIHELYPPSIPLYMTLVCI